MPEIIEQFVVAVVKAGLTLIFYATVKKYKSIHETNRQHWDSILAADDNFQYILFHPGAFVERTAKWEYADFFYLLFYDNEQLVATAVLSAFNIYLDLFINDNWLVRKLKKIFPNLFKVKILVCGLPCPLVNSIPKAANEKYADEVCSLIVKEMCSAGKNTSNQFTGGKRIDGRR